MMSYHNDAVAIHPFLKKNMVGKLIEVAPPQTAGIVVMPFGICLDAIDCKISSQNWFRKSSDIAEYFAAISLASSAALGWMINGFISASSCRKASGILPLKHRRLHQSPIHRSDASPPHRQPNTEYSPDSLEAKQPILRARAWKGLLRSLGSAQICSWAETTSSVTVFQREIMTHPCNSFGHRAGNPLRLEWSSPTVGAW